VEIIGIVVNEKGAQRAIDTQAVKTLGFPYSISETFLRKNQNQSPQENYETLMAIKKRAEDAKIDIVVYVSMAFGNSYGDIWNENEVNKAIDRIADLGVRSISLADTIGVADADLIRRVVSSAIERRDGLEIGVHLHSAPANAAEKIIAAYDVGCRRFDSAVGGLGGCPFAQDALVGNIPTESVFVALRERGVQPRMKPIENVRDMNAQIASRFS
jgi:hydroxymethylglutaryl-CoA lyase